MAPKIPKSISCKSTAVLEYELVNVREGLELSETEETWDKIQNSILYFTALINGAAADFPSEIVSAAKGLSRPIAKSLNSDRSRLSGATTEMVSLLAANVGRPFEPLIPLFVPTLLSLTSRPNKVYISRAKTCLLSIIENCQSPVILPFLRHAVADKSVSLRLTATDLVMACLNCYNPPDLEVPARAEDVEAVIRATARDSSADVRKSSRKVFEAYKILLPTRVDRFVAPLTPTMKKYLDVKSVAAVPKKPVVSSTAQPSLTHTGLTKAHTLQTGKGSSRATASAPTGSSRAEYPALTTDKRIIENDKLNKKDEEPPQRLPSTGPVRPPPSMRQAIAAARPFPLHRPRSGHPVNIALGINTTKNHTLREGPKRPEKVPALVAIPSNNQSTLISETEPNRIIGPRRTTRVEEEPESSEPWPKKSDIGTQGSTTTYKPVTEAGPRALTTSRLGPSDIKSQNNMEEYTDVRKRTRQTSHSEGSSHSQPSSRAEDEKRANHATASEHSEGGPSRPRGFPLQSQTQSQSDVAESKRSKQSSKEQDRDKAELRKRKEEGRKISDMKRMKGTRNNDLAQIIPDNPVLKRKSSKRKKAAHALKDDIPFTQPTGSRAPIKLYDPKTPVRHEQQLAGDILKQRVVQAIEVQGGDEVLPEMIPLPTTPTTGLGSEPITTPPTLLVFNDEPPFKPHSASPSLLEEPEEREEPAPQPKASLLEAQQSSEKDTLPRSATISGNPTVKPLFIKKTSVASNRNGQDVNGGKKDHIRLTDTPTSHSTETDSGMTLPEIQTQFTTPAILRTNMELAQARYQIAATPISSLLKSIERGFDMDNSMSCAEMSVIGEEDETQVDLDLTIPAIGEQQLFSTGALEARRKKSGPINANKCQKENDSSSDDDHDCTVFFNEKRPRKTHGEKTLAHDRIPFTPRIGNN